MPTVDRASQALPAALLQAYLQTHYRVPALGLLIHIGQTQPAVDDLLRTPDLGWAFISACNAHSQGRESAEQNALQHRQLRRHCRRYRQFEGIGEASDNSGHAEKSLLLLDISAAAALQLGLEFRQNALVYGQRGGIAELLFCSPGGAA